MQNKEIKEIKTATITEKGQIAIPKIVRDVEGFREGSKIAIIVYSNRVELRPLKVIKKLSTALVSEKVLAKDWNSKRDNRAWKDL